MSNIRLVTGYAGEDHITAADAGSLYAGLAGAGEYVMKNGNGLAATVMTNNQIRILDGDLLMQGRHARIEPGESVDLTIENGASGYYRHDLIVARYTKDATTGVESVALAVIKGEANTVSGSDPAYTHGDILTGGAMQNDMPLYRIALDGLNVQEPVALYTALDSFGGHAQDQNNPHGVTPEQIGAAAVNHTHAPSAMGAAAENHTHLLEGLSNVIVCTSAPSSVINGKWYLVRES